MKELELEKRMMDLESQVAFQEETIEQLNQLVAEQNHELATFKRHLQLLAGRLSQIKDQQSEDTNPVDERPPHY
ncbi:SlyX family protein [Aliidiomarina soli]|uniref:Protein SlyX homolog n=1 Tax=Aliidiomarina soli TaxID=1928574 RepID=A0A432WFM4_9GAMM|nr:SlyX family protein [Aliidiomarina soli]RUO32593.1 homocysteine methyltransferase [Aliidiomarina soli]